MVEDNCAARLVALFGSQAEVARAFQVDRAVVHHWVKTGYVPARWAGEVERLTGGRISALEVIQEASAKNPVRVKSRPLHAPFGLYPESPAMTQYAPAKRIQSFHPPQRTLMGPGPTEIHPRVLATIEPAGDRLPRPSVRRDDGRAEEPAALRLSDEVRARRFRCRAPARSAWSSASSISCARATRWWSASTVSSAAAWSRT
ncbi:MAG: YdaS family helix-turn-helix protein [Burkholderiales bacterium]|nr:YdaS family helix-turn-helix protein [Burkholderiales bacterium]